MIVKCEDNWSPECARCGHWRKDHRTIQRGNLHADCRVQIRKYYYNDPDYTRKKSIERIELITCPCEWFLE